MKKNRLETTKEKHKTDLAVTDEEYTNCFLLNKTLEQVKEEYPNLPILYFNEFVEKSKKKGL